MCVRVGIGLSGGGRTPIPESTEQDSNRQVSAPAAWMVTRLGHVWDGSGSGVNRMRADLLGTVATAEDLALGFHTVADDPTAAVGAARGQRIDRALETIVSARLAAKTDLHGLVVVVAAYIALCHCHCSSSYYICRQRLTHDGSVYHRSTAARMPARLSAAVMPGAVSTASASLVRDLYLIDSRKPRDY